MLPQLTVEQKAELWIGKGKSDGGGRTGECSMQYGRVEENFVGLCC